MEHQHGVDAHEGPGARQAGYYPRPTRRGFTRLNAMELRRDSQSTGNRLAAKIAGGVQVYFGQRAYFLRTSRLHATAACHWTLHDSTERDIGAGPGALWRSLALSGGRDPLAAVAAVAAMEAARLSSLVPRPPERARQRLPNARRDSPRLSAPVPSAVSLRARQSRSCEPPWARRPSSDWPRSRRISDRLSWRGPKPAARLSHTSPYLVRHSFEGALLVSAVSAASPPAGPQLLPACRCHHPERKPASAPALPPGPFSRALDRRSPTLAHPAPPADDPQVHDARRPAQRRNAATPQRRNHCRHLRPAQNISALTSPRQPSRPAQSNLFAAASRRSVTAQPPLPFRAIHDHASNTGTVAAITEPRGFLPPSLDPDYLYDHSNTISPSTISDLNGDGDGDDDGDHSRATPEIRPKTEPTPSPRPAKRPKNEPEGRRYTIVAGSGMHQRGDAMLGSHQDTPVREPSDTPEKTESAKPKRVRTGCLTCRQRHLKCDERKPDCWNCIKSNRKCEKGLRLNWTDMKIAQPPTIAGGDSSNWPIAFQDESREIASEYKGGMEKYPPVDQDATGTTNNSYYANATNSMPPPASTAHVPLPPIQGIHPDSYPQETHAYHANIEQQQAPVHHSVHSRSGSDYSGSHIANDGQAYVMEQPINPAAPTRMYLRTQEEVLFMQVFVEEVGIWMDSMDSMKHFSRLLPFHALDQPMLLNAFLACGARHLALVNPKYSEEKALSYYDNATRHLLDALQDPARDTVLCATTAVILNVYEIMCERALQRMNHIAGARALIKECHWNARSTGIGSACFWLNVGMEILSCLHFNWQVAWDPNEWGVDMKMVPETEFGKEEVWTHRIVYIVAKVCNFRASIPRTPGAAAQNLQARHEQWQHLKGLAETWNERIPRTMQPMAYLTPGTTISGSAFPEVWLIKRTSIVARLFYHTCLCLLAQINPLHGPDDLDMQTMLHQHSQMICGISAHVKDRGVASVALRSLAIAAECLTERREQEEVLQIFDKIRQETGWRVGFLNNELKQKWGWDSQSQPQDQNGAALAVNGNSAYQQQPLQTQVTLQPAMPTVSVPVAPPVQARPRPPMGVMNPLLATADFTMPQHPYQSYYVAPNSMQQATHQPPTGNYY